MMMEIDHRCCDAVTHHTHDGGCDLVLTSRAGIRHRTDGVRLDLGTLGKSNGDI